MIRVIVISAITYKLCKAYEEGGKEQALEYIKILLIVAVVMLNI